MVGSHALALLFVVSQTNPFLTCLDFLLLAVGVMVFAGGAGDWTKLANVNDPLPQAMKLMVGENSNWLHMLVWLGLFGLIASFHGIILGYSRQIFALARESHLPHCFAKVHPRFKTPHRTILAGGVVGIALIFCRNVSNAFFDTARFASVFRNSHKACPRNFRPNTLVTALFNSLVFKCSLSWHRVSRAITRSPAFRLRTCTLQSSAQRAKRCPLRSSSPAKNDHLGAVLLRDDQGSLWAPAVEVAVGVREGEGGGASGSTAGRCHPGGKIAIADPNASACGGMATV